MPLWTRRCSALLQIGFLLLIALGVSAMAPSVAQSPPSAVNGEPLRAGAAKASTVSAAPHDPTGKWVLNLGKRTIFVLSIEIPNDSNQRLSGSFARPLHFQFNGSMEFSRIENPTEVEPIIASGWKAGIWSIAVQTGPGDRRGFSGNRLGSESYLFS